jgi:predicted transcriptional regulator
MPASWHLVAKRLWQDALPVRSACITLYYMAVVTVRLERDLDKQLTQVSRKQRKTRSEIVRDALRRQLALLRFEEARRQIKPLAANAGYLTDEDVFRDVS